MKFDDLDKVKDKGKRLEALINLSNDLSRQESRSLVTFNDFLHLISKNPKHTLRDIFQLFRDMVWHYIPEGVDEYESPESIGYVKYECEKLFVENCQDPFFADRLFANRFMKFVDSFDHEVQNNNHIYLFEGPPGSGKSTFLNNMLSKLEEYCYTPEGSTYEIIWKLDVDKLSGNTSSIKNKPILVSCPNRDHPILLIPKQNRAKFIDELIPDDIIKQKIFESKQYSWIFKDSMCCTCESIYNTLLDELEDPMSVFNMVYVKKSMYNRKFGKGISIFNPGDNYTNNPIKNVKLQEHINEILKSDTIQILHSDLSHTNNGVYALMDIKDKNVDRLISLHGIISDGIHKVDLVEERLRTLFFGLVNPEDKKNYENIESFRDRIQTINIPYILDYKTESIIYKNKFGDKISELFLPRILDNFAKIIVSTRMNPSSEGIKKWIPNSYKYSKYMDSKYLLLKMDIYSGKLPDWLSEEDIKSFDKTNRYNVIIKDSECEGIKGISGRNSLTIFNNFMSQHSGDIITMSALKEFFSKNELLKILPEGFLTAICDLYDFDVLQEIRTSLYHYNKEVITKEVLNYLYAVNFDIDTIEECPYTNDKLTITEELFKSFENIILGTSVYIRDIENFRNDIRREYVTKAVSIEVRNQGKNITETELFNNLFERYSRNIRENALDIYATNDNFRRALLDFGDKQFESYDSKTKSDIDILLNNLVTKYGYTKNGAKQVALYVLDNKLNEKFPPEKR